MSIDSGKFFIIILLLVSLHSACSKQNNGSEQEGVIVASVFDHDLHIGAIPKDLKITGNPSDSSALVNAYADQWVRKMLLLHEAEKRKPESLDIEKLVEDYKQSLLINNLEKQVITEELDTLVKKAELESMYNKIKENFIQEYPIIKLSYYKISEKAPQIDKFYDWWKKKDSNKVKYYSEKYGEVSIDSGESWNEWNDLKNMIDPNVLSRYSFNKSKSIQKNIGEYEYFIEIIDFVDKNEISPLSYIEDQIKNIIIQKRKTSVMDEYLERVYLKELKKKNIVLHNNKK